MPRTRVSPEMRSKARLLRNRMTKSESMLWNELRDQRGAGLKFRRQAPIGPYIVDFVCLSRKFVIEVDGDGHESQTARRHDSNRDAYLVSLGYRVVRVDAPDVLANAWQVAREIAGMSENTTDNPTRPLCGHPPLKGEGKEST